jgi:ATP-dependent Clp protease ATP-binding subunit ClpC
MAAKVNDELKKHFKPEFLNRVDETIVFPQLSQDELLQIVDLFVRRLRERMLDRDMTLDVTDAARRQLLTIGWDPMLGARPLRRAIQHEVEDMLSEKILNGELATGQHVLIDFANDEFTAVMTGSILPVEEPAAAVAAEPAPVVADTDSDAASDEAGAEGTSDKA